MVLLYFRLEKFIKEMDDIELEILLPSGLALAELKTIGNHLVDFNQSIL
jgi:hypothetical protein